MAARGSFVPRDAYTPDLIEAADCILGKVGYGTTSEAIAHVKPFVHVRRDYFNEQAYLIRLLQKRDLLAEMPRTDFYAGKWAAHLEAAYARGKSFPQRPSPPPRTYDVDGGRVVAARVEALAKEAAAAASPPTSPPILTSTIVSGYVLKSAQKAGCIVKWRDEAGPSTPAAKFSLAQMKQLGFSVPSFESQVPLDDALSERGVADFVALLAKLRDSSDGATSFEGGGGRADGLDYARRLLNFGDGARDIVVARAPGRLDVMGGIADYSGSLVLQLPVAEACFAAMQLQPCAGEEPQLRIVSVGDGDGSRARNPFFRQT